MLIIHAIWRFWRLQNDTAKLCLATALATFIADIAGMIASLFVDHSTPPGTLSMVGVFYLMLALTCITWRSPSATKSPPVQWQYPQNTRLLKSRTVVAATRDQQ